MIKVYIYSAHPHNNPMYGGASKRDVTGFCQSVSWSFSLNSPYETINLSMIFPLASYRNKEVIPVMPGAGDTPDTGFWVTVVEATADGGDGPLLAWGVADSVSFDIETDEATGTLMCGAQVSISSWVHYVNRHRFTLTTWKASEQAGAVLQQEVRLKRWGPLDRANLIIQGNNLLSALAEVDELTERNDPDALKLSSARDTITDANLWFKEFIPDRAVNLNTKGRLLNFIDSFMITKEEMGVIVAGLRRSLEAYKDDLSEDISCVPLKTIMSEFWDKIKLPQSMGGGNFSQKITVLEGNTTNYVDKVGPELALELSRMGMAASVLTGYNPNTLFLPDGGTWGWLQSAFMFDPNYMELYPTLIPVDLDKKSNTETRVRAPAYVKEMVFDENQRGLAFSPEYSGRNNLPVQMQPALVYRLKPYHPTVTWKGASFEKPTGGPLGKFTLEGKSKFFPEKPLPEKIHEIHSTDISGISFSVAENTKINMTAVRKPIDGVKFGYGFSSIKQPTFQVDRILGFGISYEELAWPQFSKNEKLYEALSEYLVAIVSQGRFGEGSVNINYHPYIKAGHWFSFVGGEEDPLGGFHAYVESASHRVSVQQDGTVVMSTNLRFSCGTYDTGVGISASNFGPGNI